MPAVMLPWLLSPRLLAPSAALVLAVAVLTGCATTRPEAPPASSEPASGEGSRYSGLEGEWAFVAMQPDHTVEGTLAFEGDSGRIEMPGFTTDSEVRDSRVGMRNDSLRWEGSLSTVLGPSRFVIGAVRDGDTMRGFAEIESAGTYQFHATRSR